MIYIYICILKQIRRLFYNGVKSSKTWSKFLSPRTILQDMHAAVNWPLYGSFELEKDRGSCIILKQSAEISVYKLCSFGLCDFEAVPQILPIYPGLLRFWMLISEESKVPFFFLTSKRSSALVIYYKSAHVISEGGRKQSSLWDDIMICAYSKVPSNL